MLIYFNPQEGSIVQCLEMAGFVVAADDNDNDDVFAWCGCLMSRCHTNPTCVVKMAIFICFRPKILKNMPNIQLVIV